jgi:hypothetical protein
MGCDASAGPVKFEIRQTRARVAISLVYLEIVGIRQVKKMPNCTRTVRGSRDSCVE